MSQVAAPPAGTRPGGGLGPGPIPDALLRALELTVRRRVESLLAGEHLSGALGPGTELAQVRRYEPGDDVRRIDWNVTARTGDVHVRDDVAERSLTSWLLLDTSPSMAFGTARRQKSDVAEGVALAFGHLATRRGGRLGVLAFGGERSRIVPPAQGRRGMLGLISALRRDPAAEEQGSRPLGDALTEAARLTRQRGLIVLVSDLRGELDIRRPLLQLADRHDVLVVEIRDPREQELPDVGDVWLRDPESGRQLRVDTSDEWIRRRFAARAAEEREEVAGQLSGLGIDHLVLGTERDWLRDLALHLRRRKEHR